MLQAGARPGQCAGPPRSAQPRTCRRLRAPPTASPQPQPPRSWCLALVLIAAVVMAALPAAHAAAAAEGDTLAAVKAAAAEYLETAQAVAKVRHGARRGLAWLACALRAPDALDRRQGGRPAAAVLERAFGRTPRPSAAAEQRAWAVAQAAHAQRPGTTTTGRRQGCAHPPADRPTPPITHPHRTTTPRALPTCLSWSTSSPRRTSSERSEGPKIGPCSRACAPNRRGGAGGVLSPSARAGSRGTRPSPTSAFTAQQRQ